MVNGAVYAGSDDNKVYALNAATGATLWSYSIADGLDASLTSSPAVANGTVYVGSTDTNLYAFGLTGTPATPARPNRRSLHPDYNLPQQR